MKIIVVSGGFDPVHSEYIAYLSDAKAKGDLLIVALNSDDWLLKKKVNSLCHLMKERLFWRIFHL